jgi:acyl-coenzyme A thioesterase PaaI-like protein
LNSNFQALRFFAERSGSGYTFSMWLQRLRDTFFIRVWAFAKVPMIWACHPTVIELSAQRCEIKLPLRRFTKNHLKSMYFGALAVGADVAGGLMAIRYTQARKSRVSLVFKDFKANFLKRPESDVHFSCEQGDAIRALVEKAETSGERENLTVHVTATCPSTSGSDPVAVFELTLSLKRR